MVSGISRLGMISMSVPRAFSRITWLSLTGAAFITDVLRENEKVVDLSALRDVKSLEGYSAVIFGAPFYMFK